MRTLIVRQSQPVRLSRLIAALAQVLAEHGELSVVTDGMTTRTLEYANMHTQSNGGKSSVLPETVSACSLRRAGLCCGEGRCSRSL
jgi:hypothetical protein